MLHYKGVPFKDVAPSALQLYYSLIKPAVGRAIMPTLATPEGPWLQDSALICDMIEHRFPEPLTAPPGPTQRLASELLELWSDEWFALLTLHYRWNVPENHTWAVGEFGRKAFPWLPGFLSRRLAAPVAASMQRYRPIVGITEATIPGIEAFTRELIAALDVHFATTGHAYLLGASACRGDFALSSPLWAHLLRDPHTRYLFDDAPACRRWLDRLHGGASAQQENRLPTPVDGDVSPSTPTAGVTSNADLESEVSKQRSGFLPEDAVPMSLDPVFRSLFRDMGPFIALVTDAVDSYLALNQDATRVPRVLGDGAFRIGGAQGTRKIQAFTHWKAQRVFDAHTEAAEPWLKRVGGLDVMRRKPKERLRRVGIEEEVLSQEELRPVRPAASRAKL